LQTRGQKTRDGFIVVSTGTLLFSWWSIYLLTLLLDRASMGLAFELGPDTSVLVSLGAKIDPLIAQGEVHRLVLSPFLHSGFEHVLINSLWLLGLAWGFRRLGKSGLSFAVSFIVGAVVGQLASFLLSLGPSVGASGGIYALMGALLSIAWSEHSAVSSKTKIAGVAVLLLLAPLLLSRVDHAAHLAGLSTGIWLYQWQERAGLSRRSLSAYVVTGCFLLLSVGGMLSQRDVVIPKIESSQGPFELTQCERLANASNAPCLLEPNIVFASEMSMAELEAIEPLGAHEFPRSGQCHTVTRRNQNIVIQPMGNNRVRVLATDINMWPRFLSSIRRFIDGRCLGI